jgi:hypothetical protein
MSELDYPQCIRELYESEILGEQISLALLREAKSDRDKYHIGTLLQLETETKARLRPFLHKYGMSLEEEADASGLDDFVGAYKTMSWQEFATFLKEPVQSFLERFEEIAAATPPEDRPIVQSMVDHEAAILRWATLESAGPNDDSLDAMIAQLKFPLVAQ